VGDTLTEIATLLMSRTSDLDRAEAMIEQLRNTLENRAVIEQAKGMISRDHQVSVEVAFEMLRRHSRNTNTPVRVLARAVTDLGMQIPDFVGRIPSTATPARCSRFGGKRVARFRRPAFLKPPARC
jgi:hypothetical protein